MRRLLPAGPAVLAVLAALATGASCGGSGSETPWPVEPYNVQAAPPSESATPSLIVEERPDAGTRARP